MYYPVHLILPLFATLFYVSANSFASSITLYNIIRKVILPEIQIRKK